MKKNNTRNVIYFAPLRSVSIQSENNKRNIYSIKFIQNINKLKWEYMSRERSTNLINLIIKI